MAPMLAVLSATHAVLVVLVVVLLFGSQKIPSLMRAMGSGVSEFKRGLREGELALLSESGPPLGADRPTSSGPPETGSLPSPFPADPRAG